MCHSCSKRNLSNVSRPLKLTNWKWNHNLWCFINTGWHQKNGNFWKTQQKLKISKKKNLLTEIEPLLLVFSVIQIIDVWKLRPVDGVVLHECIFHCHYAFQNFQFFCVTLCVLHALQNATLSHSAEHATNTGRHKRMGTFEMRSGSERMHTWRRTPSTGRNFETLIIWITVS